ncbi:7649_t:CDS:1, partial [Gigaspora rosea]
ALQTYSNSEKLIDLLQEFVDDSDKSDESDESDHESINNMDDSDKENDNSMDDSDKENSNSMEFCIKNPKVHCGKGRPKGTKRLKSAHEAKK